MSVMNRPVLVLNRGWNPIAIVSLKKAMCKVIGENARILDPTKDFTQWNVWTWEDWTELKAEVGEDTIHSASATYRIPEIILVTDYGGFPQKQPKFSRRTIYSRDNNQCMYCGKKPGTKELSLDHVLAKSRGGETTWTNIVLCCTNCNRRKGSKTMAEASMKFFHPGYKPYKPKFTLFKTEHRCKSWESLMGLRYWDIELENDNK